ncbi:glycosyltransferase family 4 protein [Candidatus Dojkabacteria bacterium]|uniref:Glycosyltransferase family 4 protein n=1 Tax=Candidatus Dojkabacteria bacterium TaxID=2099670 RepID=A0A955RJS7_9BACT|nr:glycosyltransferase family 4 protein [Candidatus Dojkabacteria bacterium]
MNVLILNYEYPPVGGGGGVATKSLAEEMVRRGHSVSVLTTHMHGLAWHEESEGVKIYRVPVLFRRSQQTASLASLFTWPFTSIPIGLILCLRFKFDIINTQFFSPTGPTGYILSKLTGIPNCIYGHGADIYDPARINKTPSGRGLLSRLLLRSLRIQVKGAEGIAVQSNDTKMRLEALLDGAIPKITVIPLPFQKPEDNFEKEQIHKSHETFNLISLGRIVKRKGYEYLLRALQKLPEDITLTIVGDGPEKSKLEGITKELEIMGRVRFTGYVSEKEKYKLLKSSDCYVLSSLHEGMGIVVQEAMFVGLPIVATNNGGQNDLLEDTWNALLVPPKSVEKLAEAIMNVYNDTNLQIEMSKRNREAIREYFVDEVVNQYEHYFLRCIK